MHKPLLNISFRYFLAILIIWLGTSFTYTHQPDESLNNTNSPQYRPAFFHNHNITDGPYIFYENDKIVLRWIKGKTLKTKTILGNNTNYIKKRFGFNIIIDQLKNPVPDNIDFVQKFTNVNDIVVISDVHGQYEMFIELLQQHNVINSDLEWCFGNGHLVVLGDIFDRGSKVTELLWLVYRLEQQAEKDGGKVHYILGNHELMVLNNDLRYINDKYIHTANKMNMVYTQLFAENTFFGKWLRSKPVMVTINDLLFVHAGISPELVLKGITAEKANRIFYDKIIGKSWDIILNDSISTFLLSEDGPIWHRGFFENTISDKQLENILSFFNTKHIIIGHTSMPNIISLRNGRIIAVDSNIKEGNYGEILIYKSNEFFRGTSHGTLMKLEPLKDNQY